MELLLAAIVAVAAGLGSAGGLALVLALRRRRMSRRWRKVKSHQGLQCPFSIGMSCAGEICAAWDASAGGCKLILECDR